MLFYFRLEERLAQRRARLAEKQQASEALSLSTDSKQATKEQKKLEAEVEEEKKKIKQVGIIPEMYNMITKATVNDDIHLALMLHIDLSIVTRYTM